MEFIGWLSASFLGLCGLPQAYFSWKRGKADDVSLWFLIIWGIGECFGVIYVSNFKEIPLPLLANYVLNIILISIILKYKIWPRIPSVIKD